MFAELDAFMDDASARRLGAGASFYGKRKSSFYGENDKMKKTSEGYDPTGTYVLHVVRYRLSESHHIANSHSQQRPSKPSSG